MKKGAIYYTDNCLDERIAQACRTQLRNAFPGEIVSATLKQTNFGDQEIVLPLQRGYLTMFTQILCALEKLLCDVVFFCEHDVLYPPEHFDFTPPTDETFYYDINWWKVREDGLAVHWDAAQVSGLCCDRQLAIRHYQRLIAEFNPDSFKRRFEPTVNNSYETWRADVPHVDIRHKKNLTYNKWKLEHFRNKSTAEGFQQARVEAIPGWDPAPIKALYT